jgi:hypothetical protein
MKLENGRITILINPEGTIIEIEDATASVVFARLRLSPEQLSTALGRTAMVKCEIEINGLEKVGKTHENKYFTFEIPADLRSPAAISKYKEKRDSLHSMALAALEKEGLTEWQPDNYFSSQNSFFQKEGKSFARCTIRRWI